MRLLTVTLFLGLVASPVMAQGTIVGTKHDFKNETWNVKTGEVCAACHIPHVEGRPAARTVETHLWGRQLSTVTYTMYTSTSLDGTVDAQPTGTTRLCLGCHDGSVDLELFHTTTTGTTKIAAAAVVPGKNAGTDFNSDHPVSITYNDGAGGDPGLRTKATAFGGVIAGQTIADILEGGTKVACMSCHDPHNVEVPTGAAKFLRIKNDDPASPSALCLACHIK